MLHVLIYFVNHACIEASVASCSNAIGDVRSLAACLYHRLYCPAAMATQVDPACSNSGGMTLHHNPEFGQIMIGHKRKTHLMSHISVFPLLFCSGVRATSTFLLFE